VRLPAPAAHILPRCEDFAAQRSVVWVAATFHITQLGARKGLLFIDSVNSYICRSEHSAHNSGVCTGKLASAKICQRSSQVLSCGLT
jgi:hypothetical protein